MTRLLHRYAVHKKVGNMTKGNGCTPQSTHRLQSQNKLPPIIIDSKQISKHQSDHESEASAYHRQDNEQAVGVAKPNDQCLSTIGGVTARFRGRRGIAAETSVNSCGIRTKTGSVSRGRSRTCRFKYRARRRYVHSRRILSSTGIICTASGLAGRIVARARSHTLISKFLALMIWDR